MGSSTRNSYPRSKKVISQGIEEGNISLNGTGLEKLLSKLIFPKKGTSKIKTTLQENLYSDTYTQSIIRLSKLSKIAKTGGLSSIGFGGGISVIELKEKISDFIGVTDNELLKTSLNETLDYENVLDSSVDILDFISQFTKNIISNVFKQFTYEDTLNELEGFDTNAYNSSIDEYMEHNVIPDIKLNLEELKLDNIDLVEKKDEQTFVTKVKSAISKIINNLKGKGDK